jgi:hypothetical protein
MDKAKPADPFAFFREMVTQWESTTNEWGNKLMSTPEAAQAMQVGTATALKVQQSTHEAMAKALAAANMPSKTDVEALGTRLVSVEAQLARIEALLSGNASVPTTQPRAPAPKRTRKPPPKST